MASYVGAKILLTANDGIYTGKVHSMDEQNRRITLDRVTTKDDAKLSGLQHFYGSDLVDITTKDGAKLSGLQHFYGSDLVDIQILESPTRKTVVSQDERGPPLMRRKLNPPHLKKLKDIDHGKLYLKDQHNNSRRGYGSGTSDGEGSATFAVDRQSRSSRHNADGDKAENEASNHISNTMQQAEVPNSTDRYTIIDEDEETFTKTIELINKEKSIGISLEGVSIDRGGKLCWLQIACADHVYLFDIVKLGNTAFSKGLKNILENGNIQKVIHDCRFVSDMLFHQFDVKLVNVFDTQVAAVLVYKIGHGGDLPRHVPCLSECLFLHLELSVDQVYIARHREASIKEDMAVWAVRPVSKVILEAAIKNCIHLQKLKITLRNKMMAELVDGVDIYLSIVRDVSDQTKHGEKMNMRNYLPSEFKNLQSCAEERRNRFVRLHQDQRDYDQNGFRQNHPGMTDPHVKFSHDGVMHAGSGVVERSVSPDLAMRRRGRARSYSTPRSNYSSDRSNSIVAMGRAKLREAENIETSTFTEVVAKNIDIKKMLNMPYIETGEVPEAQAPKEEQSVPSGGSRTSPKYSYIPAGLERVGNSHINDDPPDVHSGMNRKYSEDKSDIGDYDAIPDSAERIKASLFDSKTTNTNERKTVKQKVLATKSRLPHFVTSAENDKSAFRQVTPSGDGVNSSRKENLQSNLQMENSNKNNLNTSPSNINRGVGRTESNSVMPMGRGKVLQNLLKGLSESSGSTNSNHNGATLIKGQFADSEDDISSDNNYTSKQSVKHSPSQLQGSPNKNIPQVGRGRAATLQFYAEMVDR